MRVHEVSEKKTLLRFASRVSGRYTVFASPPPAARRPPPAARRPPPAARRPPPAARGFRRSVDREIPGFE
jgi:hypothetical protein